MYHDISLYSKLSFECFKCEENQNHPDYKGHLWSRNVGYHYKNCRFGCSDEKGIHFLYVICCFFEIGDGNHQSDVGILHWGSCPL